MELKTESKENESDDEQEFLVYVDLENNILPSDLDESNADIHIIGVDSEHPIIEINGKIFEGTYDFSIGTNLFFVKDENPPPLDPLYDINPGDDIYKLFIKTNKILKTRRMLIESNRTNEIENKDETFDELKERLKTDMTYTDALKLLLSPGNEPPLDEIDDDSNNKDENNENDNNITVDGLNLNDNKMEIDNESGTDEENKSDPDYVPENDI